MAGTRSRIQALRGQRNEPASVVLVLHFEVCAGTTGAAVNFQHTTGIVLAKALLLVNLGRAASQAATGQRKAQLPVLLGLLAVKVAAKVFAHGADELGNISLPLRGVERRVNAALCGPDGGLTGFFCPLRFLGRIVATHSHCQPSA